MTAPVRPVELLVCTRCRIAGAEAGEVRPGMILHDRLAGADLPNGVSINPVECLSNCTRGCTVALRAPGCWTYVYGGFEPDRDIDVIVEGTTRYLESEDGRVPWQERPEHFKRNCIARIPPMETIND